MKKQNLPIFLLANLLISMAFLFACTKGRIGPPEDWSSDVKVKEISDIERDGDIPAINNPSFTKASEVNFLSDTSKVIGIKVGAEIRAYPIEIMDWHEVVNDLIDSVPVALTYSSLTGSSIAFKRNIDGIIFEYRVSGLLLNANTIFHEFDTFSDWSQFKRKGVRGRYKDTLVQAIPVFEMKWQQWKQLFPDSDILNYRTNFNRPYGTYPYGNYVTDTSEYFYVLPTHLDTLTEKTHLKEKILGVNVNGIVKGYRLTNFAPVGVSIIEDEINGEPIVIIGSQEYEFMVAYSRKTNEENILNFTVEETNNSILLLDEQGNKWTIFGESTENKTNNLKQVEANIAYRFTWETFFKNIEIFN